MKKVLRKIGGTLLAAGVFFGGGFCGLYAVKHYYTQHRQEFLPYRPLYPGYTLPLREAHPHLLESAQDISGDGSLDTWQLDFAHEAALSAHAAWQDTNGDGTIDAVQAWVGANGRYARLYHGDSDGDGRCDVARADLASFRDPDAVHVYSDTDHDGRLDYMAYPDDSTYARTREGWLPARYDEDKDAVVVTHEGAERVAEIEDGYWEFD